MINNLTDLLKLHEGWVRHPYQDSKGIWTAGCGRNLEAVGLRDDEIALMLANDIADVRHQLARRDWYVALCLVRQDAIADMAFMGVAKLDGFVNMIAALRAQDWETAAQEALDSDWARDVGSGRANCVAEMLRTGRWA